MSYVFASPELVEAAASDLANIGSAISDANTAAAFPTSSVMAAGADEVSASLAALFQAHAQLYQALCAQAATFHSQFVQLMNAGAGQYAAAEATNVQQSALSAVGAPAQTLLGHSPVGSGASALLTHSASEQALLSSSGTGGSSTAAAAAAGVANPTGGVGAVSAGSGVNAVGGTSSGLTGLAPTGGFGGSTARRSGGR